MAKNTAYFQPNASITNAAREHMEADGFGSAYEIDEEDAKYLQGIGRGKIVTAAEAAAAEKAKDAAEKAEKKTAK